MKALNQIIEIYSATITVETEYQAFPDPKKVSGLSKLEAAMETESATARGRMKSYPDDHQVKFMRKRWMIVSIERNELGDAEISMKRIYE